MTIGASAPSRTTTTGAADRSRHRCILGLAVPAIGTLVADPLMGLVDTAVVGRLGAEQLGALGLAVALLAALSWVFNFLVFGTTATIARAVGAGDRQAAGRRVAHAGYAALVLGLGVGLLVLVTAPALLRLSGAVEGLVGPAAVYLRIRALGVPFLLLGFVGHGAFRGVSDTRTPLVIVAVANVVNAVLTVVLVFPLGWGIAGAAWATVAAEVTAVAVFAVLLRRANLPLTGHGLPTRRQVGALVVVSRDLFLRTGGLVLGLLAVAAAAARIDAATAAAYQVIWQVWIIVAFFMDGFAIAGQAMIGTALGAGDPGEARGTARDLLLWGVGGSTAIVTLLLLFAEVIPRALTTDPVVLATVALAWSLAAAGNFLNGLVAVLDGVFMGAGDFAYLRTWTVISAVIAAVGAQWAASSGGGIVGLWLAVLAMEVVRVVSLAVRLRGEAWLRVGHAVPAEASGGG